MKFPLTVCTLCCLLLMPTATANAAAPPKPGTQCASVGKTTLINKKKFVCSTEKIWVRLVPNKYLGYCPVIGAKATVKKKKLVCSSKHKWVLDKKVIRQPKPTPNPPVTPKPNGNTPEPTPRQPNPEPPVVNTFDAAAWEKKIAALVNTERAKAGIAPVEIHACLGARAAAWSQHLLDRGLFEHSDLGMQYGDCGTWSMLGENIALDYTSPEDVMTGWMNSPGHRENILTPRYTHIGIGVRRNSQGTIMYTQAFADYSQQTQSSAKKTQLSAPPPLRSHPS